MTATKTCGFKTDTTAARAAKRQGLFGLTGSGQQCCPVELPDGRGWAFWTAHNYFHADQEPGTLLFTGAREINATDYDGLSRTMGISLSDLAVWMEHELGLHGLFSEIYCSEHDD
jgi:hypothetical protein